MPNPRLAARYAKSVIDLATEQNQLETLYKDMRFLQSICKDNPAFVNMLRSPIINGDKKMKVLSAITDGRVGPITAAFNKLLVNKTREEHLPEIVNAVISLYNELKGIHVVKLITATELSDDLKRAMVDKLKTEAGLAQVELETTVQEDLIGGFVLEFNNNLVDASISRDLRDIKKQFTKNIYVQNIR